MAKKRQLLACPCCQKKLMDVAGYCVGVIIECPNCGSSVLADVGEDGRMRLTVEPVKKELPTNRVAPV